MSRIKCALAAIVMTVMLAGTVHAEEHPLPMPENGISFSLPQEFIDTKGVFQPNPLGVGDDGVGYTTFFYFGMPVDELKKIVARGLSMSQEDIQAVNSSLCNMLYVISIDGDRGVPEVLKALDDEDISEEDLTEIGRAGDVTFYLLDASAEWGPVVENYEPEFKEEFNALRESLEEIIKGAEFSVPVKSGDALIGQPMTFEGTDIDGNPVSSADIFKENVVTMVNVWATWCGPCKGELADLGEMAREYEGSGAAVIGICTDADKELDECRALLEENGVDYLNLMPVEGLAETFGLSSIPTSFFVNSDGIIIHSPFVGAPADMGPYKEIIDAYLGKGAASSTAEEPEDTAAPEDTAVSAAEEAPADTPAPATETSADAEPNGETFYRVIVTDEDGEPLEDVGVQFCSDTKCIMDYTDAEGTAVFDEDEAVYTVHVIEVPDGFEETEEEFVSADTYSDVRIVLKKAA